MVGGKVTSLRCLRCLRGEAGLRALCAVAGLVCTPAGSKGFGPGFSWPGHRAKNSERNAKPLGGRRNSTGWREGSADWWSDFVTEPKQKHHQCRYIQQNSLNLYNYTWGMSLAWERSDRGVRVKASWNSSDRQKYSKPERWGEVTVGQHISSGHVSIV